MFEQAATLWNRLMGRPAEDAGDTVLEDERRVWVRYEANVETACDPSDAEGETLSAQIRDISRGGIKLVLKRSCEPGTMLTVGLPVVEGRSPLTVLACVVHVTPLADGEWAVGCNFARELSGEDLQAFGARKARTTPPDSRNWERFACNVKASYHAILDPASTSWPAKVLNISARGVGLLASREVRPGTLLSAELHGATRPVVLHILACVVHVTAQAADEWVLGCDFIHELNEQDLEALQV